MLTSISKTMLNCIDNSGAAVVECAKVLRMKRHAKIGLSMSPTMYITAKLTSIRRSHNSRRSETAEFWPRDWPWRQCINLSCEQSPKRRYKTCGSGTDSEEIPKA